MIYVWYSVFGFWFCLYCLSFIFLVTHGTRYDSYVPGKAAAMFNVLLASSRAMFECTAGFKIASCWVPIPYY